LLNTELYSVLEGGMNQLVFTFINYALFFTSAEI